MASRVQFLRLKAFQRQHGRCCYCKVIMWCASPSELGVPLPSPTAATRLRWTAEHLQPRSEGRRDVPENTAAAYLH